LGVCFYELCYKRLPYDIHDGYWVNTLRREPVFREGPPLLLVRLLKRMLAKCVQCRPTAQQIVGNCCGR
jgi:hypothetical protein